MGQGELHWWERRVTVVALALFAMVPLLWPTVPPLVDLPGHMGRYRVELDGSGSVLRQFYDFHWALIGNLGVDLLIIPVAKVFGLELGVKLIVMAIPALTVIGMLWIAQEVHGRIPPTALFALPLVYSLPMMYGFVNFALSTAVSFLAFGLWLRLSRRTQFTARTAMFLVISPLIWLIHIFGLGVLGLLVFSTEFVRYRDSGKDRVGAIAKAMIACLVLAPPLILTLWVHQSGSFGGTTGDWLNVSSKLHWFPKTLQDRWPVFDIVSLAIILAIMLFAFKVTYLKFAARLVVASGVMLVAYLLMPGTILGSGLADARLVPIVLAISILAIGPSGKINPRFLNICALTGLLFFGARIAANTYSLAVISMRQDSALAALDLIPEGSRVISFTDHSWAFRMDQLAGMAIVRRRAFSNNVWNIPGTNLMSVKKNDAPGFSSDPSQAVVGNGVNDNLLLPIDTAIMRFPRNAFDYLWLINPPAYSERSLAGMTLIWRNGPDALFKIDKR